MKIAELWFQPEHWKVNVANSGFKVWALVSTLAKGRYKMLSLEPKQDKVMRTLHLPEAAVQLPAESRMNFSLE